MKRPEKNSLRGRGRRPTAGILFCAACGLLCLLCWTSQAMAQWPRIAVSKDGTPISYEVFGSGEPTLVFVHGWCCNRSFWRKQVPYFAEKYRVVTLDLAGHGASGNGRTVYSLAAFGADVAAVVKALGARNVILIGHSMGGPVSIEAAKRLPDACIAIVGIDTLEDFTEEYTPEQITEFLRPFQEDFKGKTDSLVRTMFVPGTPPEFIDEIVNTMSGASAAVGISALEGMLRTSYRANPPNITVPVWCLNADLWPTNVEGNRAFVPEFNLRIMPGVGHFLMLESPDECNRQLDAIVQEIAHRA